MSIAKSCGRRRFFYNKMGVFVVIINVYEL